MTDGISTRLTREEFNSSFGRAWHQDKSVLPEAAGRKKPEKKRAALSALYDAQHECFAPGKNFGSGDLRVGDRGLYRHITGIFVDEAAAAAGFVNGESYAVKYKFSDAQSVVSNVICTDATMAWLMRKPTTRNLKPDRPPFYYNDVPVCQIVR